MKTCLRTFVVVLGLVAAGCGPSPHDTLAALTLPPPDLGPNGEPVVTDENVEAHLYAFYLAAPGTPERRSVREALIRHALERAQDAYSGDGTVEVGGTLWSALRLFEPADLVAPLDSPALRKLLVWITPLARQAGKPEEYLAIGHARLLLDPGDADAVSDVEEVVAWRLAATDSADDEGKRLEAMVELYDSVTGLLPAPALVKDLIAWTLDRHALGRPATAIRTLDDMIAANMIEQRFFSGLTLQVLRFATRMGAPETTVEALAPFRGDSGYVADVVEKVSAMRAPGTRADAGQKIAEALGGMFPEESRRLCGALRLEFPGDGRFAACLAQYHYTRGEYGVAARFMLEAMSLVPDDREFADTALSLLATEIDAGIDRASWTDLEGLYAAFDAAWRRYRAARPEVLPPVEAGEVMGMMARAALVLGDVDTARSFHARSIAERPSASAYLELGEIEARSGNPGRALELFGQGLALTSGELADRMLVWVRIHEQVGVVRASLGEGDAAHEAFDEAIEAWGDLARSGTVSQALADANIGRIMVLDGQGEAGIERVVRAVRAAHEDGGPETTRVLQAGFVFLHTLGAASLLADLFPFVVTDGNIDPNDRVYYALWTLGASRREGLPDDPDAAAFLAAIPASGWWLELARLYRGQRSLDEVLEAADTPGQGAEARYYEALNRMGSGDLAGARALLQQVVDSRIYSYVEWLMADAVLDSLDAGSAAAPPSAAAAVP